MHEIADVDGAPFGNGPVPFGKEMQKYFYFDRDWRNLNHGSFGTYPRPVGDVLRQLHEEAESRPDPYIRIIHVERLNKSRHLLARYLNAPPATIVLVPNTTTGVNTFFYNQRFNPGDTILCFSTTYSSCVNTLLWIAEATPAKVESIPLLSPASLSHDSILRAVEATIEKHRKQGLNPRVLLLDTIVSQPALRMPYERLVQLCRKLGVLSVVDAAHGIGHIPLDLTALDPDFLVTNAHKWLFVPRACAVMYVPQRNQHLIRTSVPTSAYFVPREKTIKVGNPLGASDEDVTDDNTPFVKLFEYVGTLDSSPYLCVEAALRFREEVCGGEAKIQAYCADLAQKGGNLLAKMLDTEVLDNKEGNLCTALTMVNVRLPLDTNKIGQLSSKVSATDEKLAEAEAAAGAGATSGAAVADDNTPMAQPDHAAMVAYWLEKKFMDEFNTFVAVRWWGGSWWTRLSAQIYLDMDDFEWLGNVFLELCERVRKGEHLKK